MKTLSVELFLICLVLLVINQFLFGSVDRTKVENGIKSFNDEQWNESLNYFQDALIDDPVNPLLHFNVGGSLYKNKKYEEAINSFQQTLSTNDVSLQEKSYYNMGNSYYQLNKYQEAIDSYKKALELDPEDLEAKYNLEYVRAKLKEMAEKQPSQQQQQNQQGEQQQNSEQKQNQEESEQNQEQENQQENNQQQNPEEQQQEQQQQLKEEEKKELTKEEAEQILRALRSKTEENKKLRPMPKQVGKARVDKDW